MKKTTAEMLDKAAQAAGLRWMIGGGSQAIGVYLEQQGSGLVQLDSFDDPKQAEAYMRGYGEGRVRG